MVISHRTSCVFVHIQKTGGASIESALRDSDPGVGAAAHDGRRHMSAREIRDLVDPEQWRGYFKFAFVRNPWDRLVSWYHMCVQVPVPNRFASFVREHAQTFDDFVTKATTGLGERTTRSQLDYLTDERGEVIVDFIGRYEALHEDFSRVQRRLGLPAALPHVNRSVHGGYRTYYSDETREIVARRFDRDIRYFGYVF